MKINSLASTNGESLWPSRGRSALLNLSALRRVYSLADCQQQLNWTLTEYDAGSDELFLTARIERVDELLSLAWYQ